MKKLGAKSSRKLFNSTANKTKVANLTPRVKRGGIRA